MCADSALLPEEQEAIASELKTFHWDPRVDLEVFALESRKRAIAVIMDPEKREALLKSVGERLATTEAKSQALDLCPVVFTPDGEFAPEEHSVFHEIKRAFGWPA